MSFSSNPVGLDGFDFVEFSAPDCTLFDEVFSLLGMTRVARHRHLDIDLWRQGQITFLVNREPEGFAADFARRHGPAATGMAFRVQDLATARTALVGNGAPILDPGACLSPYSSLAVRGLEDIPIYMVGADDAGQADYLQQFDGLDGVDPCPTGCGFQVIDHLTHNVYRGRMTTWIDFYRRFFNFSEGRTYSVSGQMSGLNSCVVRAPDDKIRIPINQEGEGSQGQIADYLAEYGGEGIQHIAFACDDLVAAWDALKERGLAFASPPPDTYYTLLDERLPGHGQDVAALSARGLLIDGKSDGQSEPRLLLQIFSKTMIGPIFFEFIERKAHDGFGEGNIKALFEAVERDQLNRARAS